MNAHLHAVLLQRGHQVQWTDPRLNPQARYAQRAAQRHAQWANDKNPATGSK